MVRAEYLDSGIQRQGRAGWIEHLEEDSPRHGVVHDPPARKDLPMRELAAAAHLDGEPAARPPRNEGPSYVARA